MSVLRLAIPSPLRRHFDYLPPAGMSQEALGILQPGARMLVPFGQRQVTGYLLAVKPDSPLPAGSLKEVIKILDPAPLINAELVQLCEWAAGYYQHPPGEVFSAAFPRHLRGANAARPPGATGWQLTTRGMGLPAGALACQRFGSTTT